MDSSAMHTDPRYRWPIVLFFAPIAPLLVTVYQDLQGKPSSELENRIAITLGITFVCSGLWSVWFSGLTFETWTKQKSRISLISPCLLSWFSGFLLTSAWLFVMMGIAKTWGLDSQEFLKEIRDLAKPLVSLLPINGIIIFWAYWGGLELSGKIQVPLDKDVPMWSRQEFAWIFTFLCQTWFYLFVWSWLQDCYLALTALIFPAVIFAGYLFFKKRNTQPPTLPTDMSSNKKHTDK